MGLAFIHERAAEHEDGMRRGESIQGRPVFELTATNILVEASLNIDAVGKLKYGQFHDYRLISERKLCM